LARKRKAGAAETGLPKGKPIGDRRSSWTGLSCLRQDPDPETAGCGLLEKALALPKLSARGERCSLPKEPDIRAREFSGVGKNQMHMAVCRVVGVQNA
jgi:hypothetical protein